MTNTTEAALRDAINVLRQIGSMEARTHAQRHWFAEARRIAALSQPSPATTAWTIEQARELDATLIQTARNLAGACGATQSEMREARAEFLRDWLNNNISQPSPASSTAGEGDAWEQVGFWKEKAEQAERDRDVWKERAMALRLSPSSGEPASVAVEADGWRHRLRPRNAHGVGEWSEWRDGKAGSFSSRYVEVEDCPLYAHPPLSKPTPVEAGLRERQQAFFEGVADRWNYPGGLDAIVKEAKALAALSETLPVEREV